MMQEMKMNFFWINESFKVKNMHYLLQNCYFQIAYSIKQVINNNREYKKTLFPFCAKNRIIYDFSKAIHLKAISSKGYLRIFRSLKNALRKTL